MRSNSGEGVGSDGNGGTEDEGGGGVFSWSIIGGFSTTFDNTTIVNLVGGWKDDITWSLGSFGGKVLSGSFGSAFKRDGTNNTVSAAETVVTGAISVISASITSVTDGSDEGSEGKNEFHD